ncbi:hypothetical protein R3I94_017844 [Phoxinus phoxinus]
MECLLVQMQ